MAAELPHLETFCKAAELLNFTAAADALCLTQAAVSQRIKALEQQVGTALFERHAGRISLTEPGKRLYDYAQQILALHEKALAELGRPAPDVAGDLALAASTVPAEHLLPAILQEFQKRYPKVHVVATVADSSAVLSAVEEGRVSLGLVGRPGPAAWAESKPFARDRLVLVVPPDHRWLGQKRVTLAELKTEPLVLREPGSGSRACLEEAAQKQGLALADFHVSLELGSNEAIKEAVLRGAGVALLSAFAVNHDLENGRLSSVAVADLEMARDFYVVTARRRALSPAARAFLGVLEETPFAVAPGRKDRLRLSR
jgi:DNA-binding transcriptional LysR family regulator